MKDTSRCKDSLFKDEWILLIVDKGKITSLMDYSLIDEEDFTCLLLSKVYVNKKMQHSLKNLKGQVERLME
jgi:hypothetical protein